MILDFGCFVINEASLKKLKKNLHGVLNMSARKRMRKELRDNIITFKFKKRDGTIRTAHGTLHPDYLPKLRGGAPRPEHQMVYYDLDKEGWRSFRSYSFIKILNIKPVEGKSIIPKSKHVEKEEEEETKKVALEKEKEETKKPIHKEEDEKETKKSIHKEDDEKEVKKPVHKKEDDDEDEDGEKHAYKSPIYDESEDEKKERKEDDEKIEKLKHKDEDEPKEKDKKEKSEEE